ncbi:MAG: hypothetical protein JXA14_03315 [Anaerolineae bacterium]|nr:hypothetical protein [Anaerolineae bacterium]
MDEGYYQRIVCNTIMDMAACIQVDDAARLNERHLHHTFSRVLQREGFSLGLDGTEASLHPEWPTYKEAASLRFAKYRQNESGQYQPSQDGSPGFLDFAVGRFDCPVIGVEFTLKSGWSSEENTYDLIKLMDPRLPFQLGVSLNVVLRRTRSRFTPIDAYLRKAHQQAQQRLRTVSGDFSTRSLFVILVEILQTGDRQIWHLTSEGDVQKGSPTTIHTLRGMS